MGQQKRDNTWNLLLCLADELRVARAYDGIAMIASVRGLRQRCAGQMVGCERKELGVQVMLGNKQLEAGSWKPEIRSWGCESAGVTGVTGVTCLHVRNLAYRYCRPCRNIAALERVSTVPFHTEFVLRKTLQHILSSEALTISFATARPSSTPNPFVFWKVHPDAPDTRQALKSMSGPQRHRHELAILPVLAHLQLRCNLAVVGPTMNGTHP
jgi:hypothetical protein